MPHGQWALLDSDMLVLIDGQHIWWSLAPLLAAPGALRGPLTAGFVSPIARSLSSRLAVLAPVRLWLSIHSTIDGILMHLMQVRHRFSVRC